MTPTGWEGNIEIPMRLPSVSNMRMGWREKAELFRDQRGVVGMVLRTNWRVLSNEWKRMRSNERLRLRGTLTRHGPRALDDDNLRGAFKGVRDEIATLFALDDGSPRWTWAYEQKHGLYAVTLRVEVLVTYADYPTPKETNAIIRRIKKSRITPNVRKPR